MTQPASSQVFLDLVPGARAFSAVAARAGTSFGAIAPEVVRFSEISTKALLGYPAALAFLRTIGIASEESLKPTDAAGRLEIARKAFDRLGDGPEKTAATKALLTLREQRPLRTSKSNSLARTPS